MTFKDVKDYLVELGVYSSTDDILINDLVNTSKILDELLESIDELGAMIDDDRVNPAVTSYGVLSKNLAAISKRLGLDYRSRVELKIVKDDDDGFDS